MLRRHAKFLLSVITIFALVVVNFHFAGAATITVASDTMTSIKENTTADHTVVFTLPTSIDFDRAGQTDVLRVDFPSSSAFTQSGTWIGGDFTFNDGTSRTVSSTVAQGAGTIDCTVADGVNNVCVAVDTTSHIFTIKPSATFTASATAATVTFTIDGTATDGTLTNPTSANGYISTVEMCDETASCITSFTSSHSVSLAIRIVTAANTEVGVTATVDPALTFTVSNNAIGFGTLSTSAVRWATSDATGSASEPGAGDPTLVTIATNAASGAAIAAASTGNGSGSAGLYKSSAPTKLVAAVASSSVAGAAEGYGLYVKNVGSNLAAAAGFDNNASGDLAISTAGQTILTAAAPLSANNTAVVALKVGITAATTAGSYADTITLTATGLF